MEGESQCWESSLKYKCRIQGKGSVGNLEVKKDMEVVREKARKQHIRQQGEEEEKIKREKKCTENENKRKKEMRESCR